MDNLGKVVSASLKAGALAIVFLILLRLQVGNCECRAKISHHGTKNLGRSADFFLRAYQWGFWRPRKDWSLIMRSNFVVQVLAYFPIFGLLSPIEMNKHHRSEC